MTLILLAILAVGAYVALFFWYAKQMKARNAEYNTSEEGDAREAVQSN